MLDGNTPFRYGTDRHNHHSRAATAGPVLASSSAGGTRVRGRVVGMGRIGRMTGFGQVHPLPGIWDHLHLGSAITLPIGVETYAAYALHAWLSTSASANPAARRFAHWSAITSLLLGMAGQVAYHLLSQAGMPTAPWEITTAVSCLPVLVLVMGTAPNWPAQQTTVTHRRTTATGRTPRFTVMADMEVIVRLKTEDTAPLITRMIRHYVAEGRR